MKDIHMNEWLIKRNVDNMISVIFGFDFYVFLDK